MALSGARRPVRVLAALFVGVAATLGAPPPCLAQPADASVSAEARARYARGVELYDEGSYAAALVELERANALAPSFKLLYSIGLVQVQLADLVGALRSFEAYLTTGADAVPAARRTEVEERIAQLRGRVATLEIKVSVEGAEVTVDDVPIGKSPLPPSLLVNPGRHKVVARKPGYRSDALSVAAAELDRIAVVLEPQPDSAPFGAPGEPGSPAAAADAARKARGAEPSRSVSPVLVAGWIATGTLAAGAAVTGVLALSASSDLESQKAGAATPAAELEGLASRARSLALASDVCLGGAILAGGISLYLTLRRGEPARASTTPTSSGNGLRVGLARVDWVGEF